MSENINALFPKARLDSLLAHVRDLDNRSYSSQGLAELLKIFPAGGEFRSDSVEAYYVARQLEHIRAGVMEADFPEMKSKLLVPMDTTPDEGAEFYTATYAKSAGRSRVTKDMRGLIPQVDMDVGQVSYPILSVLLAYGYTLQEVRAAMQARKSLATDRAMRCREQIARDVDEIALVGHAEGNLKGIFTLTGTSTYTLDNPGLGTTWATKTPEQVLRDWNGSVSKLVVDTLEIETPDTTVLPTSTHEDVTTRRIADGTSDTIATFFKRNNPHIKSVHSSPRLEAHATAWSNKRAMNYKNSILKVAMILPVPFEQLSPDVTSTETNTICHARTAGVVAHRPKSVQYFDGV